MRSRRPSATSSPTEPPPVIWRTSKRAIVLESFGGLDSLVYKEIPDPEPKAGRVVIEIKAFGINHAEMHMRRGEWAEAAPVSGIECVGLVKSCPGGEFPVGAKVAALMGGLGRTINGSYAELLRNRPRSWQFEIPRSLAAAAQERRSSVTSLSGTKPYFFSSLRINLSAACLFLLVWTSTSRTLPSASTARQR